MKVLVVKLTSMGDLVQALPAVTDAAAAIPGLEIDWVVDEAFAEVPAWHPAVKRVIRSAHRRWRRSLGEARGDRGIGRFLGQLRQTRYDVVIDAQTNIKSALVTACTRGPKHGPDRHSVREYPAHWAYRHRYAVPKDALAVDRWRQMFATVLDYPVPVPVSEPDFGLGGISWPRPDVIPRSPYLVFVPNASWDTKFWIPERWRELAAFAATAGYQVLLPWGSARERELTAALADGIPNATVLPRLSLTDVAGVLAHSRGAICMDTGLAHIAAALSIPTVTLYGPTDPGLIGATGPRSRHVAATGFACIPCYRRECAVGDYRGPVAQCLQAQPAERVWRTFDELLTAG